MDDNYNDEWKMNRIYPEEYSSKDEWRSEHGHPTGFGSGLFDWWILGFIILGVLDLLAKIAQIWN